jgi:hypothetical protein
MHYKLMGKDMEKKTIIGSIIAVAILLLMPTITAIQQNTIIEYTHNDLINQVDTKDIKKLDRIKHLLLYNLVCFLTTLRYQHLEILFDITVVIIPNGDIPLVEVKYPILGLRCIWLGITLELWCLFWNNLSNAYGWNWDISI